MSSYDWWFDEQKRRRKILVLRTVILIEFLYDRHSNNISSNKTIFFIRRHRNITELYLILRQYEKSHRIAAPDFNEESFKYLKKNIDFYSTQSPKSSLFVYVLKTDQQNFLL